jgi:hypothetical protein
MNQVKRQWSQSMLKVSHKDLGSVRSEWSAPRLSRLTASEAEFGVGGTADTEGMS